MLQNPFFSGAEPRPDSGSLQRSPDPLAGGKKARCPSQEEQPRPWPFGPCFYGPQGVTHYRVGGSGPPSQRSAIAKVPLNPNPNPNPNPIPNSNLTLTLSLTLTLGLADLCNGGPLRWRAAPELATLLMID